MALPIPFGNPNTYAGHSGVDYPQARGTLFRASGHGYVRNVGKNVRGGNYVWVKYDGYPAVGYHHMDQPTPYVRAGSEVWENSPLGLVGSLGQFSTGPHLHSEVEGRATSSGYWTIFDRNRVVGSGSGAGGGTSPGQEEDMTPEQDALLRNVAAFIFGGGTSTLDPKYFGGTGSLYNRIRNIEGHLYAGGPDAASNSYLGSPGTVYNLLKTPVERGDQKISQIQDNADTNSMVRDLIARPGATVSDAQIKLIADSIAAQIGKPEVNLDYAAISKAVRAEFKTNPLS